MNNNINKTPNISQFNIFNYVIIFILMIAANFVSTTITGSNKDNNVNEILLNNIAEVDAKVSEIQEIVKLNASEVKLKDRLDPALAEEFKGDKKFLNNIVSLKKKILKRKLENEAIKFKNEKIARDNTDVDRNAYTSDYERKLASKIFDVMMINAVTGNAIIRMGKDIISVKKGDNVKGFIVRKIEADAVILGQKGGEDERLGLNYLTTKIYQDKENKKEIKDVK